MRYSSFHIQVVKNLVMAAKHNNREIIPESSMIGITGSIECTSSSQEVHEHFHVLLNKAFVRYQKRTGQNIQTDPKKFIWEAVVVTDEHHTLNDILKLAQKLEKKYGWRILQVALHKDEGYIDEATWTIVYNYHAHIIFLMIDSDGIYRFKKRNFGSKVMSDIQTLVAEELKMPRGAKKIKTKKEHLNHKQYRQIKKEMDDMKLDLELARHEADNFLDLLLHEHELHIKDTKKIAMLQEQLEEEIKILKKENFKLRQEQFENSITSNLKL